MGHNQVFRSVKETPADCPASEPVVAGIFGENRGADKVHEELASDAICNGYSKPL
jgi:hypothetical protein